MPLSPAQTTLHLAFQAVAFQLAEIPSADPQSVLRASSHLVRGFCAGFQGDVFVPASETPSPADPIPGEWEAFLRQVRTKELTSRGPLNEGAMACACAFLAGALEVFPEAKDKIFLRTLHRVWGVKMSPTKNRLGVPVSRERLEFSRNVGRHGGERLRADYEAGSLGGLGRTVLEHKLHLRNVEDYLEASGWLLGTIASLKDRFAERSDLLVRNHASVIHRAFHGGNQRYPEEVVEALPSLLQTLNLETARWETSDPDAAEALRSNRDTIINYSLHSGNLRYPEEAVKAIPGMLKTLDDQITRWKENHADAANALKSNRASIVTRTLNRGNFRYPEEAVKHLLELLATLDREIARLNPDVSKTARILEANRATVVMRALADGDFGYAEEVVKKLPKLLRDLDREISRLADADPEAAKFLKANRKTMIDRTLNSGVWNYWKKVAKAMPSLLRAFEPDDRAAGIYAAIISGELEPRRKDQKPLDA